MNLRYVFHSKLFWGLGARILNLMGGFIILPLIIHYLDKESLSLYYLFASLTMLTTIIDFGFNATLTRNFSYAYSGAKEILSNGVCADFGSTTNWNLVADIYLLSKKIYLFISSIALFIFFLPCSIYIYYVVIQAHLSILYSLVCWVVFSFSAVLALYFTYLSTLIQGRGDVNTANKITIVAKVVNVVISVIMLLLGYGLFGVCISSLSMAIVERALYYKFSFQDKNHLRLKRIRSKLDSKIIYNFKIILANASKFGVVAMGGYLVTRATIIIAVSYLGLSDSASYIFSIQLVTIIMGISSTLVGVYIPKLNSLANQDDLKLRLFCFSNLISLGFYIFFSLLLLFCGHHMLLMIGSKTMLLDNFELIVILFIYFLEVQHSNYAALITTDNTVPFVKSAIYSGIATVVLAILLVQFTQLSVWGLIIAQGLVQLVYNNWYWVYYICKKYRISYFDTLRLAKEYKFR